MKPITQKRAKLTPEHRAQLDADYDAGVLIAVIAEKYGCHESYPVQRAKRARRPVRPRNPGGVARPIALAAGRFARGETKP